MGTVIFASDHFEFDSGQILSPPALHQHHVVLLQVVSLPGDERHRLLPVREAHLSALPVGRVGLLGFPDHGLQDHRLQLGTAERGADSFRRRFGFPLPVHLVEGGHRPGEDGSRPGRGMLGRCRQGKVIYMLNM